MVNLSSVLFCHPFAAGRYILSEVEGLLPPQWLTTINPVV